MKDTFYFSHDYNASSDQKILTLRGKFGLEGYALFWLCIESMAQEKEGYIYRGAIGGLSLGYGVAEARLKEFLEYCISIDLLRENDKGVYSKRLMEHKELRADLSQFGKKGAEKRWQENGVAIANKGKERKGKENIVGNTDCEKSEKKPTSKEAELIQYWIDKWSEHFPSREKRIITSWARYIKQAKPLVNAYGLEKCKKICEVYLNDFDPLIKKEEWSLSLFLTDRTFNKFKDKA